MMSRWMLIALLWMASFTGIANADCQTDYDQALESLSSVQNKIQKNEHPSPDVFAAEFQSRVEKLQTGKCMPELQKLLEYIQAEQKKYPMQPGEKPVAMPIVD